MDKKTQNDFDAQKLARQRTPIAISAQDVAQYGCPYCGYGSSNQITNGEKMSWHSCCDCRSPFAILNNGVEKANISYLNGYFPQLSKHPREGIPVKGGVFISIVT